MGTLNISSMDLRAVNMPARKPVKNKRPKFTVRKISTAKKVMMVTGATGLLALAFLLPPAPLQSASQETASVESVAQIPAREVKRVLSKDVAASKIALSSESQKKQLEPLSVALPFIPTTPSETAIALEVLANYALNGSAEQKEESRAWMAELRKENVMAALPALLRNHESPLLSVFAQLAERQRIPGADEAIIDRLNSTDKARYATSELVAALSAFKTNEKVVAYVESQLNGPIENRIRAWQILSGDLSVQQTDLALTRVLDAEADCDAAALALARYAEGVQKSMQVIAKAESMLNQDKTRKIRYINLLAKLNPNITSSRLMMMASHPDVSLRAAAVKAMASDPNNTDTIANILRNDSDLIVRKSALAALSQIPSKAALTELAELLNDQALRADAKRALLSANNGKDLGWQEFEWKAWIENSK